MDSWPSFVLFGAICIVGFDILLLTGFMMYNLWKWYRNRDREGGLVRQEEVINYDETVAIKTEKVPVVYENSTGYVTPDFSVPKTYVVGTNSSLSSADDVDVPIYFTELVEVGNANEEKLEKPVTSQAKLALSIYFNSAANEMTVALTRGKNIKTNEDNNGSHDLHIMVSLVLLPNGNIHHSSQGIPPSPIFKDKFAYSLPEEEFQNSNLKLNVWKIDKYSRKMPFGEGLVDLRSVFQGITGETRQKENIWVLIEPTADLKNETIKGELMITMQYLPGAGRINVSVMKGRDIQHDEFDKDIYVKVSAMANGKIIKNKKTSPLKKSSDPVFNEMTSFNVNPETSIAIENMAVMISLYAHRSRGPHRRLLGRFLIGKTEDATAAGREHWQKMIESPRKMIADWHELQ